MIENSKNSPNKGNIQNLPKDWSKIEFERTILKKKANVEEIPVSKYRDKGKYRIIDQSKEFIAGYWNNEEDVYKGELPVIIFGDHTRIFKYIDFPFVCGAQGTKVLIPNKEILSPLYFFFALLKLKIQNRGYNRHYSLLKKEQIPLPPLSEQRNIAVILSSVQEVIDKTQAVIQVTQELKRSLMHHLFTYGPVPITEREQVQLKETEIGEIPEEWNLSLLGDLFYIKQGKTLNKKAREGPNKKPFLRTSNVYWGNLALNTIDQMHFEEDQIIKLKLKVDDLLVCEGGDVGRTAIWSGEIEECMYQNHLHRLRPKIDGIYPYFYMYWMQNAVLLRSLYIGAANRTTIPNLSKTRLSQFKIPHIPLEKQKQIVSNLQILDSKIKKEQNKKDSLESLLKSLLENLMTGKKRVKDLNFANFNSVEMEL